MAFQIRITQATVPDPGGYQWGSRRDLRQLHTITFEAVWDDIPTTPVAPVYAWQLVDRPDGSAAVLSSLSGSSTSITPDETDSYAVRLIVNGRGGPFTKKVVAAVRYDSTGVVLLREWRIPSAGEEPGIADFYDETLEQQSREPLQSLSFIIHDLHQNLGGPGGLHALTHSKGNVDEIEVNNLASASNDTSLVLRPDGAGGVAWATDASAPVTSTYDKVTRVGGLISEYAVYSDLARTLEILKWVYTRDGSGRPTTVVKTRRSPPGGAVVQTKTITIPYLPSGLVGDVDRVVTP
jgi:hypothetical protein